jgi:2-aminoadipate transaminase
MNAPHSIHTLPAFADRMNYIHPSFIREILKVTAQPEMISFAGGLPHECSFPVEAIKEAALGVLMDDTTSALQYTITEGFWPLRCILAERYAQRGLEVKPEQILITNGSQQGLDLCGKIFLNPGDRILLEAPSYLGAIQAFSAYQPNFCTVGIDDEGPDMKQLDQLLEAATVKLMYGIPNFQNPTGLSYSLARRQQLAEKLRKKNVWFIEDDPYGEICFSEEKLPYVKNFLPEQTILLGSFSKIVSPGLRLGWMVAPEAIIEKLVMAKQAADLHTNILAQRIMHRLLTQFDMETHIRSIADFYKKQKDTMIALIQKYFPEEVNYTNPKGGMFLWLVLPAYIDARVLLEEAAIQKVVFVPGQSFFADGKGANTIRLNYTSTDASQMEEGIRRMGKLIYKYMCNP